MNEDMGMNEPQKEVRLWRKTDLKRIFVIQAIIDVFMHIFIPRRKPQSCIGKSEKEEGVVQLGLERGQEFVRTGRWNRRTTFPGKGTSQAKALRCGTARQV